MRYQFRSALIALLITATVLPAAPAAAQEKLDETAARAPLAVVIVTADLHVPLEQIDGTWLFEVTQPAVTLTLPAVGAGYHLTVVNSSSGSVLLAVEGGGTTNGQTLLSLGPNIARRLVSGTGTCLGAAGKACWYAH